MRYFLFPLYPNQNAFASRLLRGGHKWLSKPSITDSWRFGLRPPPKVAAKRNYFVLIILLFYSCTSEQKVDKNQQAQLSEALLGTWEIIDFEVNIPTYLGEDSTVVESIREADWAKIYGVKPARTVFTSDGKLQRTYYFANGQISDISHGLWKVAGDSLIFIEPGVVYRYLPLLDGEKLRLQGRVDWDKDGEEDDDYRANFRLVGRTVE